MYRYVQRCVRHSFYLSFISRYAAPVLQTTKLKISYSRFITEYSKCLMTNRECTRMTLG